MYCCKCFFAPVHPFGIDDVADALVRKLGHRVPAVLAGESVTLEDQLAQWEQRKALEVSTRQSCVDGIPTAQPALALAQKVITRATNAGLPADLIPAGVTSVTVSADVPSQNRDAENDLRSAVLEFMDTVRAVESAIATAGLGSDADQWRRYWPVGYA